MSSTAHSQSEGQGDDSLDLRLGIRHRIDGTALSDRLARLLSLAEVHATCQLADDQQVDALEQLRAEGGGRDQRRMNLDGSKVGEQAEPAAEGEEGLLRSDRR